MCSSFGGEVYENTINCNGYGSDMLDHRGGQMIVYNNTLIGASGLWQQIRDEYGESVNPTTSPDPQYPNRSYYFLNRDGVGGGPISVQCDPGDIIDGHPTVNVDYFTDDTTNGPAGCSSGLRSARPASGTITGQGYWATDESILYRWSGSAWAAYYTPYTYPHPLRSDPIIGD
jgi:hypothetical protein